MNILNIAISCGLTPKKVAGTNGGEYASACPMCGGKDRFRIWPEQKDGSWWCRGCNKGGDAIQLLRDAKGMSFKEACDYVGHTPTGTGTGSTPRVPDRGDDFTPRSAPDPADIWQTKATAFVDFAHQELLNNAEQLAWILEEKGITRETAVRFKLGWNPEEKFRDRKGWGMDPGKKLYFPRGLVIPYSVDGKVLRVRFRCPEGDPRYIVLAGSSMAAMIIWPSPLKKRVGWPVVESELCAMLIAQEAGDVVGVIALGNSSARPDDAAAEILRSAPFIMDALDYDAAGAKTWSWWKEHFTRADRWPVPEGSDPGEYFKAGGDIRAWILAGLPRGLAPLPGPPPTIDEIFKKEMQRLNKVIEDCGIKSGEYSKILPWAAEHASELAAEEQRLEAALVAEDPKGLTTYWDKVIEIVKAYAAAHKQTPTTPDTAKSA